MMGDDLLNPHEISTKRVEDSYVEVLNKYRAKRRRQKISRDTILDAVVKEAMMRKPKSNLQKKAKYLKRHFYELSRSKGYYNSWFEVCYAKYSAINTNGRAYYLAKDEEHYIYGKRKFELDTLIKNDTVKLWSYQDFSSKLKRRSRPGANRRWHNYGEVSKIGICSTVRYKAYPKSAPLIEVLYVLSGTILPEKLQGKKKKPPVDKTDGF